MASPYAGGVVMIKKGVFWGTILAVFALVTYVGLSSGANTIRLKLVTLAQT